MSSQDVDIESPKSIDAASPKGVADEGSVGTHPSEGDDQSDGDSQRSRSTLSFSSFRKWLLVVILAAVIALSVGLCVGLHDGRDEGRGSAALYAAPTDETPTDETPTDETDSSITFKTGAPDEDVLDDPEYEKPIEDSTKPPSHFSGIGSGNSNLSWPELVGLPGEEAKQFLEDLDEGYVVLIIPPGKPTTKDFRFDRIFLHVDEEGYVTMVPRPGR